jgi:phage terminase small subunit
MGYFSEDGTGFTKGRKTNPKMTPNKPLTAKQEAFARFYVSNGFNATQAAISAGYSEDTAQEQSARLLSKVMVKALISELQANTVAKSTKGAQDVYEMAANAAFFDVSEYLEIDGDTVTFKHGSLSDLPKELRVLIQAVRQRKTKFGNFIEIVFVDKLKALEMLARFNGMNKDKLEVSSTLTAEERIAKIAELKSKLEGDVSK